MISETNFTSFLIASTEQRINITNEFQNISIDDLLAKLSRVDVGEKDGSHFLRTSLLTDDRGKCLSRANSNTSSMASLLILDCDKRINTDGELLEGAPNPHKISDILRSLNIWHVLYSSYSHHVGDKGNRYRILLPTKTPYTKKQLAPTLESIISLINASLESELLANVNENNTWAQPWFYPRKPANSIIDNLYLEHLDGNALEVIEPIETPPPNKTEKKSFTFKPGEIWPINAFNEQYPLTDLLIQHGYKKVYSSKDYEKWLSPDSKSGIAGITVKDNKFYSHHGSCPFNNGYWHDAFDLMRIKEGLSEKEAVIYAAQNTNAPDGRTVDEQ